VEAEVVEIITEVIIAVTRDIDVDVGAAKPLAAATAAADVKVHV